MEEVKNNKKISTIILLIIVTLICISIFVIGCEMGERKMQDSAVRYNAGEYYTDTLGRIHFRFINRNEIINETTATEAKRL